MKVQQGDSQLILIYFNKICLGCGDLKNLTFGSESRNNIN